MAGSEYYSEAGIFMNGRPCKKLFTAREAEVIGLISCGARPRHIATDLCISPQTAYVHLRNIAGKLHLHSRSCKAIAAAAPKNT